MTGGFVIHDLYARPLKPQTDERGERWGLLRFEDHLLRRFGLAELVRTTPDAPAALRARSVADEVWILIDGKVEFSWHDLRPGSPTEGRKDRLACTEPTLVLAPFGVAFGYRALEGRASLFRLATHGESGAEDIRLLPWEDA
jgi:dTDP-4-dehydrorhamnose 3,5-epimerase-like enzyme